MNTLKILSYVGTLFLVVNTFLFLVSYSGKSKAYKSFVAYLFVIATVQVISVVFATKNINNHFLATYYLFFQFALLGVFFYYLFKGVNNKKSVFIKYSTLIVSLGLLVQYVTTPQLYSIFNSIGFLITSIAIILYAVLYLYELLSDKLPFLYTTIGIFIYQISSSIIFISATALVSFNDTMNLLVWKINAVLFIIYQLLILWEWMYIFYLKTTK